MWIFLCVFVVMAWFILSPLLNRLNKLKTIKCYCTNLHIACNPSFYLIMINNFVIPLHIFFSFIIFMSLVAGCFSLTCIFLFSITHKTKEFCWNCKRWIQTHAFQLNSFFVQWINQLHTIPKTFDQWNAGELNCFYWKWVTN